MLVRLSELAPLQKAIAYYYAEVGAREAANEANLGAANAEAEYVQLEESENGDMEAPIVKLLNSLLDRAISTGASDIHIEPFEKNTCVRMRLDGVIVEYVTLERSIQQPLIARIKIMSGLDIAERACRRTATSASARTARSSTSVCPFSRPCSARRRFSVSLRARVLSTTQPTSAWTTTATRGFCLC